MTQQEIITAIATLTACLPMNEFTYEQKAEITKKIVALMNMLS